ncbi:MAG TPA: S8 family peptidase [Parafilimonas sp.]|nr:S8 family peptidase [Parafilimonas sp.]
MKKKILFGTSAILLIAVILFSSFGRFQKDLFYYAFTEKIKLETIPDRFVLRYTSSDIAKNRIVAGRLNGNFVNEEWKDDRTAIVSLLAGNAGVLINQLQSDPGITSLQPLYRTTREKLEAAPTDEILVRFKTNTSEAKANDIIKNYSLKIVQRGKLFYTFSVAKGASTLQVANAIMETGLAEFSHPNFYMPVDKLQVPDDKYFKFQWNLRNKGQVINDGHTGTAGADIKAVKAWGITQGSSSITIAVLDEGLTSDHPDLPNTRQVRLNGSNFSTAIPGNDPSPVDNGNHGNACSGIIAATRNNAIGIAGIAPECKIMPIKILNPAASNANIANAITFAKDSGADVLSNSWGYGSADPNLIPAIVVAIQDAVTNGRGGKGCVVVFAAGNTANQQGGNPGAVIFPGNVSIKGVLTVGASDRYDQQANYSPTSNPSSPFNQIVDIVAPSHKAYSCQIPGETFEIWSIDIPGNAGYNPWNQNGDCGTIPALNSVLPSGGANFKSYTGRMGGTSAACPQVAAAAALVLSLDPGLKQNKVFKILTQHTDKVGGYTYNASGFSNEMGYGRLNLYKAVKDADPSLHQTPEAIALNSALLKVYQSGKQLNIQMNDSKEYMISVSNNSGQVLINTKMTSRLVIPVSTFKQGVYFIKLTNTKDKTVYSRNVMIQ